MSELSVRSSALRLTRCGIDTMCDRKTLSRSLSETAAVLHFLPHKVGLTVQVLGNSTYAPRMAAMTYGLCITGFSSNSACINPVMLSPDGTIENGNPEKITSIDACLPTKNG